MAGDEEKDYNWVKAVKLYKQALRSYLNKKMMKKAAVTCKKQGYAYAQAARTMKHAEEYVTKNKQAIKAYKKAADFFEQTGNNSEKLECEAEALYISGFIMNSIMKSKEAFGKSCKLFIESSELYSKEENQESIARIMSRIGMASLYRVTYCSTQEEIEKYSHEGRDFSDKAWKLSKETGNIQSLAESLFADGWLLGFEWCIKPFRGDERWRKEIEKLLLKHNETLRILANCEDPRILGIIYYGCGLMYFVLGYQFSEVEREQREFVDKGIQSLEKALAFIRKTKDKSLIIELIFYISWAISISGRLNYFLKRVTDDLDEIVKLGKIFSGLYSIWSFYSNYYPAFTHMYFAQRSVFTPAQRKSYAEKAIEYAKECLKIFSFLPFSVWIHQALTWSYSQLATIATTKDERDEYSKKMLQYAKQAENIAEKYEGGWSRTHGSSSLYRAYKTLADIANNKEERIKMLSMAIDAAKKYVTYSIESRTGIIAAQMRVGLLYEELGITTEETKSLMNARETFQNVVKECHERGYHSHAAAAHEYIAHLDDRLGNHIVSAEHYERAQEAYTESLKNIEYEPLKDRVKEKIEYTQAWSLIQRAKAYHKKENHLKAKKTYNKGCEILEELPSYKYEAPYYISWALQEEAEQLSKNERHEKAIERYETTRKSFFNAIKTLKKASKQSTDKRERIRLDNLEKVANVRILYCSARATIERARILEKQGKLLAAAEKFGSAASQFREVFTLIKTKQERGELEAGYYLCRAWESMDLAEQYEDPDRFAEAATQFSKASKLFTDSKLKLLASGNSAFCQALEYGYKFDESSEIQNKAQLYPKIKMILRKAASSYQKGGFESGAEWALATSTYFDAVWHLIQTDTEIRLDKKQKLLGIVSRYLKSAAELFNKAGYSSKEIEVLERLDMVQKEEKILVSALNTIKEPSISKSTIGIVTPTSPIETSLSPDYREVQQFTEEVRRAAEEKLLKKKYELVYRDLLKEFPRIQRRECRVAIAQIGVSKTGDILSDLYDEKTPGFFGIQKDKIEIVRSKVKNMIEIAFSKGVNILLFPELTIDLNYNQLLEDISNLAKAYDMYIIPGSFHDQNTKRNISLVINTNGILWEQEKHIPASLHYKGKRFKEGIDVGTVPQKTIVCNTEFGRIAIVICRDFLDMDLRVELKNFEPPVDLIFNPAFTPVTADFKAAHFDARRSIYAYCFFANIAEYGDSLIYTPEKERIERTIPKKEESIIYKDVDLFKLRSERKKWEKYQEKNKPYIQSTK
ncbi:MAG: nitrilase-related carbon-nitrogen hydrolase [Promethearchaeota archaeon]